MNVRQLSRWGVLIVVSCNGKLSIGEEDGGGGDFAVGGREAGAGRGPEPGVAGKASNGGNAGKGPVEFPAGAGGDSNPEGENGGQNEGLGGALSPSAGSGGTGAYAGAYGADGGYSGTWNNYAGSTAAPPTQGGIGQPCIPGGLLLEADGSPARTQIRTLDQCNEGLSCNAQSQCVPAPNCPQIGDLCVVRRAALGEDSGGGGTGGTSNNNGAGSFNSTAGGYNSTEQSGVTALTASESTVYWVEYGTRDALGNYQHDGALLSHAIADGTTAVVASGLEGPISVELTTSHAYIYVDGARPVNTAVRSQLLRVPLTGGTAELVQEGARPVGFAAAGSRAFWSGYSADTNPGIYSMTADANASPSVFLTGDASWLTADATDLYYLADQGMMRSPIASAAPVAWGMPTSGPFVPHEDGIFGLESINLGGLLLRAPKSGGEFRRVRALGNVSPSGLQAVGNQYFVSGVRLRQLPSGWGYSLQVLTAGFVGSDPPIRLLERAHRNSADDQLWVGTASALYWSDGRAIYQQPLPTP
ncbi:MAG TPA: hypothetical protein VGC79_31525 [Polyangiaceae bacterium]